MTLEVHPDLLKKEYLDKINSIINEAPDLFEALRKDHFN